MQIGLGATVEAVATVSNEAFALLILENYWDYMELIDESEFNTPTSNKRHHEAHAEAVEQSKRKASGKWTSAWRGSRRYCGWDTEGLLQFNELVTIVDQDRKVNGIWFQQQYHKHLRQGTNKNANLQQQQQ